MYFIRVPQKDTSPVFSKNSDYLKQKEAEKKLKFLKGKRGSK